MWQVRRTGQLHSRFWFGDLRESDLWDDLGVEKKIILKRIFRKRYGEAWTGRNGGGIL